MVVTHRAKNALLTEIWLPKPRVGLLAKMRRLRPILGRHRFWGRHVPDIGEQNAQIEKNRFCKRIREAAKYYLADFFR